MKWTFRALLCTVLFLSASPSLSQEICGNGVLDAGESCDDHNTRNDDCCSSSCELLECAIFPENLVGWEQMGPFSVGGRVTALATDPQDPLRVVLGSPAGGVWETRDGATSWQTISPWLSVTSVSAVAVHPSDPEIIVAGTGSISDGGSTGPGIGIIRSDDGGSKWWQVTSGQVVPYVASTLFWTSEPSRVLAATDLGVLLSIDGGLSFDFALQGQAMTELARDPFDADALYAASRSGLFLSRNRGDSWSRISSWPLLETDLQGTGTASLAVSHQTSGLLYAAVQVFESFGETDRALLVRSTDGGLTFEELSVPGSLCETTDSCGYGLVLAIHPEDDDRLLLGGDVLLSSHDGGDSWSDLGIEVAKVHEIEVYPQGAYVATASGVAVVNDDWSQATMHNNGLAITSVVSLDASAETPPRLLVGTADTGTILGIGASPSWSVIFGDRTPAGTARFDPFDEARLFVSRPHADFFRSDDGGESFSPITQGLDLTQRAFSITPFEPSVLVPDLLFAGLLQPFESTDGGETWHVFRPEGFPEVRELAPSSVDSDRVYFSLVNGSTMFKADDIGTESVSITTEPNHQITAIYLDPAAENILYTSLTNTGSQRGRVFKSWDFGAHWQDISPAGLPATTSIVKDSFDALYVGSADGVWRSANDGFSWARFQSGLLGSAVTTLDRGADRIFAGTSGHGVFSMPVIGLTSIESLPDGQLFWVDDRLVRTPHFVLWEPGSVHTVEPYLLQTAESRQFFQSWSDGGGFSHEVVIGEGTSAIAGAISNLFLLNLSATPPNGGTVGIQPLTADRFFLENSVVSFVAIPSPRHRFVGFTGNPSGGQDQLGFAVMDRPRTVVAEFEPLTLTIDTDPPGLGMTIDGHRTATPQTNNWSVGSDHTLAADAMIDLDPGDPVILAFDGWNDLFAREHTIKVRRETFVTNLIARYITVIPELALPERSSRVIRSEGSRSWAKIVSLSIAADDGEARPALEIIRSRIEGELISELAMGPSDPGLVTHSFVQGGSETGRTRIVLHNPGTEEAIVDLLLRDPDGNGLVLREDALRVEPGGRTVGYIDGLIQLSDPYEGLLSVFTDHPVLLSVQSIRSNLRPSTFLDPILLARPLETQRGVPENPTIQALLLTAETEHELVLSNPGSTALSGSLQFRTQDAQPLSLADGFPSSMSYSLAPGGYEVIRFRVAGAAAPGVPSTAKVELSPSFGQPVPLVQLVEEQTVGETSNGLIIIPRSIPPSRRCTSFSVPVDLTRRDSGVVLSNSSIFTAVTVEMSLLDMEGNVVDTKMVSLPKSNQNLLLGREIFPSVDQSFQGVLMGSTTEPVEAVGILRQVNGRGEQIIAGFPVLGPSTGGPPSGGAEVFPFAIDGDSWSTEIWQVGSWSTSPTTVSFSFTGEVGETTYLPMEW